MEFLNRDIKIIVLKDAQRDKGRRGQKQENRVLTKWEYQCRDKIQRTTEKKCWTWIIQWLRWKITYRFQSRFNQGKEKIKLEDRTIEIIKFLKHIYFIEA